MTNPELKFASSLGSLSASLAPSASKVSAQFERMNYDNELPPPAAAFLETTKGMRGQPSVFDVGEVRPTDESGKALTQRYVDAIFADHIDLKAHKKLYVSPRQQDKTIMKQGLGGNVTFSRTAIGENSAHGVFFATSNEERIAVKQFSKKSEKGSPATPAVTEWVNMHLAADRGFGVFEPVALIPDAEGSYLITARKDGFEPLDNDASWGDVIANPSKHEDLVETIDMIGPTLADLHHKGGWHGDTQLKNWGIVEETGELQLIDWEAATFLEPSDMLGADEFTHAERMQRLTERDLKVLLGSLVRSTEEKGVGMLDKFDKPVVWEYFKEFILTPYIDMRLELAEAAPAADQYALYDALAALEESLHEYTVDGGLQNSIDNIRRKLHEQA